MQLALYRTIALVAVLVFQAAGAGGAAAREPARSEGWLGVMIGPPSAAAQGVPIHLIAEDSPASRAGLRARDVIVSVNGSRVSSSAELLTQIRRSEAGSWIPVTISRRGDEREVRVKLISRPNNSNLRLRRGWIGARAIDLPPALREHFGAPADAGAMISEIVAGGPAEAAGLRLGDVVFAMEEEPIRSSEDLVRKFAGAGVGNKVELTLVRNGSDLVLELIVETAPEKAPTDP